jgi:hypothetical protein
LQPSSPTLARSSTTSSRSDGKLSNSRGRTATGAFWSPMRRLGAVHNPDRRTRDPGWARVHATNTRGRIQDSRLAWPTGSMASRPGSRSHAPGLTETRSETPTRNVRAVPRLAWIVGATDDPHRVQQRTDGPERFGQVAIRRAVGA